jgi:hypothetical protein
MNKNALNWYGYWKLYFSAFPCVYFVSFMLMPESLLQKSHKSGAFQVCLNCMSQLVVPNFPADHWKVDTCPFLATPEVSVHVINKQKVWYKLEFTLNHVKVRYLRALMWPQYPPTETQPRLHNPLGLSWELKSSLTGHHLEAKTAETAIPKLTQMVQSPPHILWYVFYVNINVRYWMCWKLFDNTSWYHLIMHPCVIFF